MFGTIGHEDRPIDESDIREGRVSHIIVELAIRENVGWGRALLLDTPAGRNLMACLARGSKLPPSSRAVGDFLPEAMEDGTPIVDKMSYQLECFDFVLDPGMLEAGVELTESQQVVKKEEGGHISISEKSESNKNIMAENDTAMKLLVENRERDVRELAESKAKNADLQRQLDEANKLRKTDKEQKFLEFCEEEGVTLEVAEVLVDKAEELKVSPADLADTVEKITDAVAELIDNSKNGAELDTAIEELAEYRKHGKPKEIEESSKVSLGRLSKYAKLGTPEQIQEALTSSDTVIKQYSKFGSPKQVEEMFKRSRVAIEESRKAKLDTRAKKISEEFEITIERARQWCEKFAKDDDIKDILDVRKTGRITSTKVSENNLAPQGCRTSTVVTPPKGSRPGTTGKGKGLFEGLVKTAPKVGHGEGQE